MRRAALDLLAGMAHSAVSIIAGIVATPVYLALLGRESYGVIGFVTSLQAVLLALDGGIAVSVTRRVAGSNPNDGATAGLLRGLSRFSWRVALLLTVAVAAGSLTLARSWLRLTELNASYVAQVIGIGGLMIAAKWPAAFYQAVLAGRGLLLPANAVNTLATVVSAAGAIAMLYWVALDLRAVFAWMSFVAIAQTVGLGSLVRRSSRPHEIPVAPIGAFLRASMPAGGIGVLGLALMQVDKIALSRIVPLDQFGMYAVASLMTAGLYALVAPWFSAAYPRLSARVAHGDLARVEAPYRDTSLALAAFLCPVACALAFFARPILLFWTGDSEVADGAAPLVTLLALGTAAHGLMFVPYALKLACGASRLALSISVVVFIVSIPLTVAMALAWGTIGAAAAWLLVNVLYLLAGSAVTHRRILPAIGRRWLLNDVLPSVAFAVICAALAAALAEANEWGAISSIALAVAVVPSCWLASLAASKRLRAAVKLILQARLGRAT